MGAFALIPAEATRERAGSRLRVGRFRGRFVAGEALLPPRAVLGPCEGTYSLLAQLARECIRFKFHVRLTSVHSPLVAFSPRRWKRRNPVTSLMIPNTVSTVALRRALSLRLAEALHAPAVASRVSRLVYDCNRPP